MKNLTQKLVTVVVVSGLVLGVQGVASAQHGYGGGGHDSYHGGYGGSGSYHGGSYHGGGHVPSYGGGYYPQSVAPTYHNTSHYDYHPTQIVPRGNHTHYVPGHYDLHQTGHWHP